MNKAKTILFDIVISTTLIVNLLIPTIYSGYLTKFISILTIINCILMFVGYIFVEEIKNKMLKKELKKYFKKEKKIWKVYQYLTNGILIALFVLNNMLITALLFTFGIKIIKMFKEEICK